MGIQRIVGRAIYIMKSMSTVPAILLAVQVQRSMVRATKGVTFTYRSLVRRSIQIFDWSVGTRESIRRLRFKRQADNAPNSLVDR